jgi:hypothetical protein
VTFVEPSSCDNQSSQPGPSSSPPEQEGEPPPFRTAHAAIRFAFLVNGQPSRPLMNRMCDTVTGDRLFAGLDRAAQAGIIVSALRRALERSQFAALTADALPSDSRCFCRSPCCCGWRVHSGWKDAVDQLADDAASIMPKRVGQRLRAELVAKICSEKTHHGHSRKQITLQSIAADLELDVDTVSKHHRALVRWLKGAPRSKDGSSVAIEGLIQGAWREAESALRDAGIVG